MGDVCPTRSFVSDREGPHGTGCQCVGDPGEAADKPTRERYTPRPAPRRRATGIPSDGGEPPATPHGYTPPPPRGGKPTPEEGYTGLHYHAKPTPMSRLYQRNRSKYRKGSPWEATMVAICPTCGRVAEVPLEQGRRLPMCGHTFGDPGEHDLRDLRAPCPHDPRACGCDFHQAGGDDQ